MRYKTCQNKGLLCTVSDPEDYTEKISVSEVLKMYCSQRDNKNEKDIVYRAEGMIISKSKYVLKKNMLNAKY